MDEAHQSHKGIDHVYKLLTGVPNFGVVCQHLPRMLLTSKLKRQWQVDIDYMVTNGNENVAFLCA